MSSFDVKFFIGNMKVMRVFQAETISDAQQIGYDIMVSENGCNGYGTEH